LALRTRAPRGSLELVRPPNCSPTMEVCRSTMLRLSGSSLVCA
jgi:hypothetical protein